LNKFLKARILKSRDLLLLSDSISGGKVFQRLLNVKRSGKLVIYSLLAALFVIPLMASSTYSASWIFAGQGISPWHYQPAETAISTSNAANLSVKFQVPNTPNGDVSATPSVYDGSIYFPDWAGNLYSVDANTGAVNWMVNLSTLTGVTGLVSRSTPTVQGGSLIVGTLSNAYLLSINRKKGTLQWMTQLDTHPAAVLTQSPIVYNNMIYIGVSSSEEGLAANPAYPCCTFRGSFEEVNLNSGAIMWKTYTVPDNGGQTGGYSGGAVWGSTASIDPARKLIYIGTGNNYTVPSSVANDVSTVSPYDYADALLALNMATGKVAWADPLMGSQFWGGLDTWTVACFASQAGTNNCPDPQGPDYDFGQGPMIIHTTINGTPRELVVNGQKSGYFWAVDAGTGALVWKNLTGAGSALGGLEWGSATDGVRIYYANAAAGQWGALDPATGNTLWVTNDANPYDYYFNVKDIGAISVANGVVYVGSIGGGYPYAATDSTMFALNAATGTPLWSYVSGGSVASAPAIANGVVYWGVGYNRLGIGEGAGANKLLAFSLP
jgi:polyvinyl alcohol dehydrogenase (cytochrome)